MIIKSHRELWGAEHLLPSRTGVPPVFAARTVSRDFPVGSEWDAGVTPPGLCGQQGRWTVRREVDRFVVLFYCFNARRETFLAEFPLTEQGELDAKTYALVARDNLRIQPQEEALGPRASPSPIRKAVWAKPPAARSGSGYRKAIGCVLNKLARLKQDEKHTGQVFRRTNHDGKEVNESPIHVKGTKDKQRKNRKDNRTERNQDPLSLWCSPDINMDTFCTKVLARNV